jgi:beta-glucosidase/6-phospho-beta-glucosidase/beta-galactosidase
LLQWIDKRYNHPPILCTENGCSYEGEEIIDGVAQDPARIEFVSSYLNGALDAIDSGVNLIGYMYWSLLDNEEWAAGYSKRFGITFVDFKTLQRVPKTSALWYRDLIKRREL